MKDYYAILGVISSAEPAAIKGAYHGLANNYHPDKFRGKPDEAHAKMSAINEAWNVLSDPTKKLNYDQQRESPAENSNSILSLKELDIETASIKEVQEIPLYQFPPGVALLEIKLSKDDAIQRFKQEFLLLKDKLPKNTDIELVNNARIALFPYWRFAGSVDSDYKATGITIDKKQVKCGKCNGSGATGRGDNKSRCQRCSGSGKDIHRTTKKNVESGSTTININDALLNYKPTIQFNLPKSSLQNTDSIMVPESRRSSWKCISPISADLTDGQSQVRDILSEKLFEDIRSTLSIYDAVEGIQLNPTNISVTTIPWLYPAYISWYEIKSKKYFAVCDAVTGSVTIPYKLPNKFWKFLKKLLLIMLVFFILIILIGILVSSDKPNENSPNVTEAPSENITTQAITFDNNNAASVNAAEVVTQTKFEPSFDCNKATTHLEKLICSDDELANLDMELANSFKQAELRTTDIDVLRQNTINALQLRNRCEDKECLKKWYLERTSALNDEGTQDLSSSTPYNENESTNNNQENNNQTTSTHSCSQAESAMHANGC